jgi:hypothetical protein
MRRSVVLPVALLATLVTLFSTSSIAVSQQTSTQPVRQSATSSLAECAASKGALDVLMLVDESTSLKGYRDRPGTDVDGRRVDALKAANTTLAGIADRTAMSQKPVRVSVAMIGFGNRNDEVLGWTDLSGNNLGQVIDAGELFRSRNTQDDTDYATAFIDARAMLQRLPGYEQGERCTAMLWFTDGEYSIDILDGKRRPYSDIPATSGGVADLIKAGQGAICDSGGLLDGFHLAGTKIFAVALTGQAMSPEARSFLKNTATGEDCGAALPPGAAEPGAYFEADRVADLLAPFFDIVSQVASGTPLPDIANAPVCPSTPCATGRRTFQVDKGIMSFNLLAVTTAPGISLVITSPESQSETLKIPTNEPRGADKPLGSASISWTWLAPDSVVVEADLPSESGPWNGEWSVTFVDEDGTHPGATANAEIYVFGDIEPVLDASEFRSGELKEFTVALKHGAGTPVDESLFAEVSVSAVVTDPASGQRWNIELSDPDDNGIRTGRWEAPAPDFPAAVNLTATSQITTESGLGLTPVVRSRSVQVLPPSSYPTITPTSVVFPKVVGTKTVGTDLKVRGGEITGGCVWLEGEPSTKTKPDSVSSVTVSAEAIGNSPSTCLAVGRSAEATIPLTLIVDEQSNGAASGSLKIAMKTDRNPDVVYSTIEWRVPLEKSVDSGTKWLVFFLLMAIGVLLPLVVMWVINAVTGRFAAPGGLRLGHVPARISSSGVITRRETGTPIDLDASDFIVLTGQSPVAGFSARGLQLKRKLSVNPFVPPRGEVRSDGAGMGALLPVSSGSSFSVASVPFGLAGVVVVRISRDAVAKAEGLSSRGDVASDPEPSQKRKRQSDLDVDLFVFVPATNLRGYVDLVSKRSRQISDLIDTVLSQNPVSQSSGSSSKRATPQAAGSSAGPASAPPSSPPRGVSAPGTSSTGRSATPPVAPDGGSPPAGPAAPPAAGGGDRPPPRHS